MTPAGSRSAHDATQLVEVLDRVLDRGIVVDAEITLSVAGLALAGLEARIVVATIETYLEYADELAATAPASWSAEAALAPDLLPLWVASDIHIRNRARRFLEEHEDDPE